MKIYQEKSRKNIRKYSRPRRDNAPEDFAIPTIENRLECVSCTVGWTRLLYDRGIVLSDLIPKMADTLAFLHDIVKDGKYEDGEIFIKSTLLYRIVKPATEWKR